MSKNLKQYFDNNANTPVCKTAVRCIIHWTQICGNPSSSHPNGLACQKLLSEFQESFRGHTNTAADADLVICSCASEANSQAIKSMRKMGRHVVIAATEHMSAIHAAEAIFDECSFIPPRLDGRIYAEDVSREIRDDTAGVIVMHVNNETGIINDIKSIADIVPTGKWFHCDTVQSFGKCAQCIGDIMSQRNDIIVSAAVSFHKLHGPIGVGALICNRKDALSPLIYGEQNGGMRGGTYNVSGIAGALGAMNEHFLQRAEKNGKIRAMKKRMFDILKTYCDMMPLERFLMTYIRDGAPFEQPGNREMLCVCFQPSVFSTASIILLPYEGKICNGKIRTAMENRGFIISISSACNTSKKSASHVLGALIRAAGENPEVSSKVTAEMSPREILISNIKRGFLRISFGDENDIASVERFAETLISMMRNRECNIN